MKRIFLVIAISFLNLLASRGLAAIKPVNAGDKTIFTVAEILQLPEDNRRMAAMSQPEAFYDVLIKYAFNTKHTMSLRWRALLLAAEVRKERSVIDLVRASKEPEWFMRNAALIALKDAAFDESLLAAKRLIKDPALVVRSAAADVLSNALDMDTRDLFWEELHKPYNFRKGESLWIRAQMTEFLASHPDRHESPMFASLLDDKDLRVQNAAIHGLEKVYNKILGSNLSAKPSEIGVRTAQLVSLWKQEVRKE